MKLTKTSKLLPLLVTAVVALAPVAGFAQADSAAADSAATTEYFVIQTSHRLFPNFHQVDTVDFDEPFFLGEEEWRATIVTFNPHLGITMDGESLQMSDTLYNPAVRIRVVAGDSLIQESWGFYYTDAPHYYRNDMFGFKLLDFHVGSQYIKAPGKD